VFTHLGEICGLNDGVLPGRRFDREPVCEVRAARRGVSTLGEWQLLLNLNTSKILFKLYKFICII